MSIFHYVAIVLFIVGFAIWNTKDEAPNDPTGEVALLTIALNFMFTAFIIEIAYWLHYWIEVVQ